MDRWKKMHAVELDTKSPMTEVRGYHHERPFADYKRLVKDGSGFFVHERLVRERSTFLAEEIDLRKTGGEKKVVFHIRNESRYVSAWIDWLYGRPIFPGREDEMHDEVLEDFVETFLLSYRNEDYECVNLCLDAIRDLFLEGSADLGEPLDKLKPVLDMLSYDEHENVLDMIVHKVVYGPGADSGQTKLWLKTLADHYQLDDWASFWQRLGLAFATKAATQASGDVEDIPDFMAEHAYHLCQGRNFAAAARRLPKRCLARGLSKSLPRRSANSPSPKRKTRSES